MMDYNIKSTRFTSSGPQGGRGLREKNDEDVSMEKCSRSAVKDRGAHLGLGGLKSKGGSEGDKNFL